MKRSDIILAVNRAMEDPAVPLETRRLLWDMHQTTEGAYTFLFALEAEGKKDASPVSVAAKSMAELLRKKLEDGV